MARQPTILDLLDLEYIESWSLWRDAKILMRTVAVVLQGSGA